MTLFLFFITGCSLLDPGVTPEPKNGAQHVNPQTGVRLRLTGVGTKVAKLTVTANDRPVKAKIGDGWYLYVNGRRVLDTDTKFDVSLKLTGWQNKKLSRRFVFTTIETPQPLLPAPGLIAQQGHGAEIKWNIPVKTFTFKVEPETATKVTTNNGKKTTYLELPDYKQGQQYKLTITDAVGLNGYRLKKHNPGYVTILSTTVPLTVQIEPNYGAREVSRSTGIVMTFNENIMNQAIITGLFSTDPVVPGSLTWPEPNKLTFLPASPWDYETTVAVNLKSGLEALRGVSGSYLEGDVGSEFETGVFKRIDINLATQTLTLLEGGTPVYTCLVSSGKAGYSTPTGDFRIYEKDRVSGMAAAPDAAEYYNIPDVPYVMWFHGNYSIHGAYWHNDFGNVRSHGCVNVSVGDGEHIFGWASVGTPVSVHY